jgi:hypothetical protein
MQLKQRRWWVRSVLLVVVVVVGGGSRLAVRVLLALVGQWVSEELVVRAVVVVVGEAVN